jgi:polysaccharide pyruvyl transferase WcaK-like protein
VNDLIDRIQSCDIMIASRFHGTVLPLALQKPVVAFSYSRKIGDIMTEFGQAEYHRELAKADLVTMKQLFQTLEQNRHMIALHLGTVAAQLRDAVNKQYEVVFGER